MMDERARRALLNKHFAGLSLREWLIWVASYPFIIVLSILPAVAWSAEADVCLQQSSDLGVRICALQKEYGAATVESVDRRAALNAELTATQKKLAEKVKEKDAEIERLKKLCAASCEDKKEQK